MLNGIKYFKEDTHPTYLNMLCKKIGENVNRNRVIGGADHYGEFLPSVEDQKHSSVHYHILDTLCKHC
jgi:hypothetical protein